MKHFILPDAQVKPEHLASHLELSRMAGEYAVDQKPDVIVCIGDWWDMASLSSYDKGTKSFEGRRYKHDIEAGNAAMDAFMKPIRKEQKRLRKNKKTVWKPRLVFTAGNHEYRIDRAIEKDAMLEDVIGYQDFNLEEHGWEVYPFLEVVQIDGVCYSHYFTSGVMGRPVSSARAMVTKKMQSCVMGHVQDRDIAFARRADSTSVTGIFVGIYYEHDEGYLNAQTNRSWRGLWVLHEVQDGAFDEMPVSLNYLKGKYGNGTSKVC